MTKTKVVIALMLLLTILVIPSMVNAEDTYTATSTINGITVNWEYELNENNQIEELKCTNADALTGSISIPSIIDEKEVISIGDGAFENAPIAEAIIPDSIKTIEYGAFKNCTSLSEVDLGGIESISFDVFKGCTSLKEITIPKTLKNGSTSTTFTNCTNLTKITFEDGLTVVPSNLCATTGITEITIPDSVEKIEYGAFDNCVSLTKIIILDNVTSMGFFSLHPDEDSVFENHNEDLTIYCYEGTTAAEYAMSNNIKYVYLTKPVDQTQQPEADDDKDKEPVVKPDEQEKPTTTDKQEEKPKDTTTAKDNLPDTGRVIVLWTIAIVAISGIVAHIRYKKLYM